MSLFKTRDWWSTSCGNDEKFGPTSLCIANIDNDINQSDKLILGSHNGILRIYTLAYSPENYLRPFQPNDLLLEVDLKHPILQVATGLLVYANKDIHLAVLQPRKLSIYSITVTTGLAEHGSSYNILLIYEHSLERSAYNFILGPFGQAKGRDFFCVQSLDGTLSFYEQESFAFSRFLTNFLLPGPIAYISSSDSFVVSSSSWSIESYRYQVLAIFKNDINNSNQVKKVAPDWSLQIGEPAIDIQAHYLGRKFSQIVVLGEKNLFIIKENGIMLWMKKFEFNPISMYTYVSDNCDTVIILIATLLNTILVYSNQVLKWSSKLPFTPIAITRADFKMLKGALIFLSEDGHLCSSYLGTNPSISFKTSEGASVNYQEMEKELTQLKKIINSLNTEETFIIPNVSSKTQDWSSSDIQVTYSEPVVSMDKDKKTNLDLDKADSDFSATFSLNLETIAPITNIRVNLQASSVFLIDPNILFFSSLPQAGEKITTSIRVTLRPPSSIPSSLELTIVIVYTNAQNASRIFKKTLHLPLSLIATVSRSQKESTLSFSFDVISSKPIDLRNTFTDLVKVSPYDTSDNHISISLRTVSYYLVIISIVSRAPKQKFRIKSNSFETLSLIINELLIRLKKDKLEEYIEIDQTNLPFEPYFDLIDDHLRLRKMLAQQADKLSHLSAQFRVIEKRLLVKLKDRNPTPLCNLDLLLDTIYSQIVSLINQTIETEEAFEIKCNGLSAATKFISTLLMIEDKSRQELTSIQYALSTDIHSDINEGWEERTEFALINILNYKVKDQMAQARFVNRQLSVPENTNTLKELISNLFNRVFLNQSLTSSQVADESGGNHASSKISLKDELKNK